jgi:hypothetical protein
MRPLAEITVSRTDEGDPSTFDVRVVDERSRTEHRVTASNADLQRLSAGRSPEDFVRACFEFLLEREPKESILGSFDVRAIGRYFPEFEREIVSRA